VQLPPEHTEEFRHIAEEDLGPLDDGVAGGAEGNQKIERRNTGLAVMNGEDGLNRCRLAALAGVAVPIEHPFAEAGELPLVGPYPAVAALAETAGPDRDRAAAAKEHPLPATPDFPSLHRSRLEISLRRRGRFSSPLARRFGERLGIAEERPGWGEKLGLHHQIECNRE
jgi:hypothetical protein